MVVTAHLQSKQRLAPRRSLQLHFVEWLTGALDFPREPRKLKYAHGLVVKMDGAGCRIHLHIAFQCDHRPAVLPKQVRQHRSLGPSPTIATSHSWGTGFIMFILRKR